MLCSFHNLIKLWFLPTYLITKGWAPSTEINIRTRSRLSRQPFSQIRTCFPKTFSRKISCWLSLITRCSMGKIGFISEDFTMDSDMGLEYLYRLILFMRGLLVSTTKWGKDLPSSQMVQLMWGTLPMTSLMEEACLPLEKSITWGIFKTGPWTETGSGRTIRERNTLASGRITRLTARASIRPNQATTRVSLSSLRILHTVHQKWLRHRILHQWRPVQRLLRARKAKWTRLVWVGEWR